MFDEEIRDKISFDPLKSGGASFETKILTKVNHNKLSFKHTTGYVLFSSAFFILPLIIIVIIFYKNYNSSIIDILEDNIVFLSVSSIFLIVSAYLFYDLLYPIVFDKSINKFYKGYNKNSRDGIALNKIIGIQIIGEIINSDDKTFKSYELNLILDDFVRVNVIDHGNGKGIVHDAETISNFLNIPIWYKSKDKQLIKQESKYPKYYRS